VHLEPAAVCRQQSRQLVDGEQVRARQQLIHALLRRVQRLARRYHSRTCLRCRHRLHGTAAADRRSARRRCQDPVGVGSGAVAVAVASVLDPLTGPGDGRSRAHTVDGGGAVRRPRRVQGPARALLQQADTDMYRAKRDR